MKRGVEVSVDREHLLSRNKIFKKYPQKDDEEHNEYIYRIANNLTNLAGKNLSHIYSHVVKAVLGGRVLPMFENSFIGSRPDLLHRVYGNRSSNEGRYFIDNETEVKATSTDSAKFYCLNTQFEKLCFNFLKNIDKTGKNSGIHPADVNSRYAFVRYHKSKYEGHLGKFKPGQLLQKARSDIRDITIIPLNVAIPLLKNCRLYSHNQTSSQSDIDYQRYWRVKSGMLNTLQKNPSTAVDYLLDGYHGMVWNIPAKQLGLSELCCKQYQSPRIQINGKPVAPFSITKFYNEESSYMRFIETFYKKHHSILSDFMGLRDLYVDDTSETDELMLPVPYEELTPALPI